MTKQKLPAFTTSNIPNQTGKRVIITGANSGIGWNTALELARKGAEIVLPARTAAKAEDGIARIRAEVPTARLIPAILDLASLASVRAFAAEFVKAPIDLLINNAGVMALPTRELTPDGFERQFATNFLGPFALTALLLPAIKPQSGSRIVTVASSAANQGKIEFDNLQSERRYVPMFGTYSQSKLADLIFAIELQRRLTAVGSPILSTAAHPGYAITNLQANYTSLPFKIVSTLLGTVLSQDSAAGALPTLLAAVSPYATPGGYYGPDGLFELKGKPTTAGIPKNAKDIAVAKRLWSEAERLTGVSFGPLSNIL
jgi:NAD(P)-dependent dehydrogenase (short-subunit alcohol dehydrogenase family)